MHGIRVSASTQMSMIDDALKVLQRMRDHLDTCKVCNDNSFCPKGEEIRTELSESKRGLKRIGYE